MFSANQCLRGFGSPVVFCEFDSVMYLTYVLGTVMCPVLLKLLCDSLWPFPHYLTSLPQFLTAPLEGTPP